MLHPQLTLALGIAQSSSFESYYPGVANANAVVTLRAYCANELDEKQLFLWGDTACGKTHLLSAACQDFAKRGFQVGYLTGDLASLDGALSDMENADLFCVDDVHLLESQAQERLFHCINRCRESGTKMLFSASTPIDELGFSLADLVTRLSWGPVFQLQVLADNELPQALALQLQLRGLEISDDVLEYIMRRYPRNMQALTQLVDQLDQASLTEQRRITIPLVRELPDLTV